MSLGILSPSGDRQRDRTSFCALNPDAYSFQISDVGPFLTLAHSVIVYLAHQQVNDQAKLEHLTRRVEELEGELAAINGSDIE